MRAQLSNRDYEQLSAYLDGQLAAGERKKLEDRLRVRPELKEALDDLSRTRALLRMAPRRKAPRNFTLTPAMVGESARDQKAQRFRGFNLFPALSFASALAALLLVAVILFDFAPRPGQTAQPAAQPPLEKMANPSTEAPRSAQLDRSAQPAGSAPPVIVWQGYGMGGGGGNGNIDMSQAKPAYPGGLGGGGGSASGLSVPGINGVPLNNAGSAAAPGSGYSIPPQSGLLPNDAQSLQASSAEAVHPNPNISGAGPILGVPPSGRAGEVLERSGVVRNPQLITPAPTMPAVAEPSLSDQPAPLPLAVSDLRDRQVLGLPALRLIEAGLLAIGIAAGVAAVLMRRKAGR